MRFIAVGPQVSELKPAAAWRKTSLFISALDVAFTESMYEAVHQILLADRDMPSSKFLITAAVASSHISTALRDLLRAPGKEELNRSITVGMLTYLTNDSKDADLRTVVDVGTFAGWPSVLIQQEIRGAASRIYYSDVFIYAPEFASLL
ncbi:MAG: hypothetical protein RXR06_11295 [Thermoproteus sp.]